MTWTRHVLGGVFGGALVVFGLVTVLFISNTIEWRHTGFEDPASYATWTSTSHSVDLWGIGEQTHTHPFAVVAMGTRPEEPHVLFGSIPRVRVHDQNGTLIADVVPPQTHVLGDGMDVLAGNITIATSGTYTIELDDVELRAGCRFELLGYPNTLVYPYSGLRRLGVGLVLIGVTAVSIVVNDAFKTLRKMRTNSPTSSSLGTTS